MRKTILFFLLLSSPLFAQNEIYVSPAGNNTSAGTLLQPWQTAQYALDHATPGCTIYLMGGSYHENLNVPVSGTAADPIIITSYAGQAAVIDGTGTSGTYLLKISGKSYIQVKHLTFTGLTRNNSNAILVEGNSRYVQISNNTINGIHFSADPAAPVQNGKSARAIAVMGNDPLQQITSVEIIYNSISDCRTGKSPAVEVSGNVGLFNISRNKIHDITNSGLAVTAYKGISPDAMNDRPANGLLVMNTIHHCVSEPEAASGILVDGALFCRVENNALYANTIGLTVQCSTVGKSVQSVTCRNNTIYRNQSSGMLFGGSNYPVSCGAVEECSVNCNTFFDNNSTASGAELFIGYTSSAIVKSNIIDGFSNTVLVKSEPGNLLAMDYNLYYCQSIAEFSWNGSSTFSFAGWQTISNGDANSLMTNPQFVNPYDANLHLEMNSPAIDRGDSAYFVIGNEVDMDTMTRIQNGRVDIGADEYGTTVGIADSFTATNTMFYEQSGTDLFIRFFYPLANNMPVTLYDVNGKTIAVIEAKKGESSVKFSSASLARGLYVVSANGAMMKIVL